jgi:hypothetical protein
VIEDTFFGNDHQQTLLRRGRALFDLLSDDSRLTYYGRTVGLMRPTPESGPLLDRLIALQGASTYADVALEDADALQTHIEAQGYAVTRYACWSGGETALDAARAILARHDLPKGITAHWIDQDAPDTHLEALADVALGSGVLPLSASVLRGQIKPGLGLVALDENGAAASCAAASSFAHTDDAHRGGEAWWGMLATATPYRGQKLALVLGAMALLKMHDRFGFSQFMTGVQSGNAASEMVCTRMGLRLQDRAILTVVDPTALPGGKMTS